MIDSITLAGFVYLQAMHYIRIEPDEETRWINLAQVSRATLAKHGDRDVLVLLFAHPSADCALKIEATSKRNAAAIKSVVTALDAAAASR
jgi:hypothetical protein